MQEDVKNAMNKIDKVLQYFWSEDPILYHCLSIMDKVPNSSQETIGINIKGKSPALNYNPNFVNTISQERLEMVLVNEGFKILLKHCTTRLRDPYNIAHLSSNLAINQLLNSDLQMILNGIDDITPNPAKFGLEAGEGFETYFRELMNKIGDVEKRIKENWDSLTDEEKKKLIENAQPISREYKKFENEDDAIKSYFDPNGTANIGWSDNNLFESDIDREINKIKGDSKSWGTHTGNHKHAIMAARENKISAKEVIKRFGASVKTCKTRLSRMKLNRRYGLERPGVKRTYKPRIIMSIDSSMSMSDEDVSYGLSTTNMLLYYAELIFVLFDTEIKLIETNFKRAKNSFNVVGRGGTDFNQICEYADEIKCDGLIIYTDGYAPAPPQPKCNVLWLMHSKDLKPPVSWGSVSHLERYSND